MKEITFTRIIRNILVVSSLTFIVHSSNAVEMQYAGSANSDVFTPKSTTSTKYAKQEEPNTYSGFSQGSKLFSTREERIEVGPAEWNENTPLNYAFDAGQMMADEFAGQESFASGGQAAPDANEAARNTFSPDWEAIEEIETERVIQESEGGGIEDLQFDNLIQSNEMDSEYADDNLDIDFDGTHGVFTRYGGNSNYYTWRTAPWNKIGKLYFTTPSGDSSYCTANVVSDTSVIATAAHCVYTRGQGWNSNFVFVPAERYGYAPYGTFGWSSATVLSKWITDGGRRWDVGVIKLGNNSANLPVTYYVGWLGRSWNYSYSQHLHSFGYASNISTEVTSICAAESFYSDLEGPDVLVKGCDMTYGSSGGGWIKNYMPFSSGYNYVNGVVSGPHIDAFGTTYVGPRFSTDNIVPLCDAIGC